jgi:hypothetical protein
VSCRNRSPASPAYTCAVNVAILLRLDNIKKTPRSPRTSFLGLGPSYCVLRKTCHWSPSRSPPYHEFSGWLASSPANPSCSSGPAKTIGSGSCPGVLQTQACNIPMSQAFEQSQRKYSVPQMTTVAPSRSSGPPRGLHLRFT